MLSILKQTFSGFSEHNCPRMAAALAYYAIFSLPPLLVIAITLAGFFANMASLADDGQFRQSIEREVRISLGDGAAEQVEAMINHASQAPKSVWGLVVGAAVFLFGASGVMVQLQASLNEVWGVIPDPARGGVRNFLLKRVLSFAMVMGVGFLLIISMVISGLLALIGDQLAQLMADRVASYVPSLVNLGTNLVIITLVFAGMFKWLADAKIKWRDVWMGAFVTAMLFIAGKTLLTLYFAKVDIGSTYGAAGSLALILTWVYYSGLIFLLGAEFTRAISFQRHGNIRPQPGAVLVETIIKEHPTSHKATEGKAS